MAEMKFNAHDQEKAAMEGWALIASGLHGLQIRKDDWTQRFNSDHAAMCHVVRKSRSGERLHRKALELVRRDLVKRAQWLRRP